MTVWRQAMLYSGLAHGILLILAGFWLQNPPPEQTQPVLPEIELAVGGQVRSRPGAELGAMPHSSIKIAETRPLPGPRAEPTAEKREAQRPDPDAASDGKRQAAVADNTTAAVAATGLKADAAVPASGGVLPPRVVGKVEPVYPEQARRRRIQGSVVVRVEVQQAGQPRNISVWISSGHAALDQAAVEAVAQWAFAPARDALTGVPLVCITHVPVSFHLET